MALVRWQATVQDGFGNVVVNPSITVRNASSGSLAPIYDDVGVTKANPFTGGTDGFVSFKAFPGKYIIEGAKGGQDAPDWIVDLAYSENIFSSRSSFVAAVGSGLSIHDGINYTAGGISYVGKTGASVIPDLPGLIPSDGALYEHWGSVGNGVVNDATKINSALASGIPVAGVPGKTYGISGTLQIPSGCVVSGAFKWVGAADGIMSVINGTGVVVRGCDFDGSNLARYGIHDTSGGNIVEDCKIKNLRSTTNQVVGIHGQSALGGSIYRRNSFLNFESVGDVTTGNVNGASRAVLLQWTANFQTAYDVYENTAINVIGEEGDAFQVLAINGTTFYSSAGTRFSRNTVVSPSKRGFKIQAHDTIVSDNIVKMLVDYGGGSQFCISVQSASRCIVSGNYVETTILNGRGIVLSIDAGAAQPSNTQVIGNTVITAVGTTDLAIQGRAHDNHVIAANHITNGRIVCELSANPDVSRNQFFNTLSAFADGCISFRNNCTNPVAIGNVQHSGAQSNIVRTDCQKATIMNNVTRAASAGLSAVLVTTANNVVVGNVNALTGVVPVVFSGTTAGAQILVDNNVNLGL